MKSLGFACQTDASRFPKPYVRPTFSILTLDQVQTKLADAPSGDRQAEEWIAINGKTQRKGLDNIQEQLRLALAHLSNAQKDRDLASIIDALELAYVRD